MTPKEAVESAKKYIVDMFSADGAMNVGLEELRFDERDGHWLVTIGFTRGWEGGTNRWTRIEAGETLPRTFKTVEISDSDGRILQLKHWPVAA